ncbi:MAG TPA: DUF6599 family protein [Phycisphaerae bacterium]|nr:DUF6599 family protein [Phycisphaerae bacterium]
MPTFFARRYMRDRVGRREKAVGALVLAILGVIVIAVVAVAARDEPTLFDLAEGTFRGEPSGPHARELRVARSMMPSLGTAGWALDDALTVTLSPDLPDDLAAYGVRSTYHGRYANLADREQYVEVEIFDAGLPENAFALLRRFTPQGAGPLPAGNEGWTLGERGGFWAGRYYTRFDRSHVPTEQPGIKVITDALASVQITYGTPFWAQDVFPAENRLPGTFRYLPVGDPGLFAIDRCFAVSYPDGVTALAARAPTASAAAQLLDRAAAQIQEFGSLSQSPSPQSPIASGTYTDQYAFLFAQDRTVCGAVGPGADRVSGIASAMLDRVRPASVASASAASASRKDESPFPSVDLPGWNLPDNVRLFDPTNLWEKIDGRADLYLAYNVSTLTFGSYRGDNNMSLDVYWYDMTEADNAFGIYQSEFGGHPEPVDVGRDGYTAGGGVFFWKGAHYVRVEATEDTPELSAAARAVAAAIAAVITDDGKLLWADALLPQENRRPDSFEYYASDAFGLDFLSGVFSADYDADEQRYKLFIHRAPDPDTAAETFSAYVRFFEDYGKVLNHDSVEETGLLIGESGGVIDAVFVSGRYLGGVNGVEDAKLAEGQAQAFRALLAQADSPTEGDR